MTNADDRETTNSLAGSTSAAPADGKPSTSFNRHTIAILAVCFLTTLIEGVDMVALPIGAHLIKSDFGLDHTELGWLFSITNIGLVVGASYGGALADRFGRKLVFASSIAFFGLCTLALPFSPGFWPMLVLRALSGVGFGAMLPIVLLYVLDATPQAHRSMTTTIIYCGTPVGGTVAAFLGSFAEQGPGWRMLFYVGGLAALIVSAIVSLVLPKDRPMTIETKQKRGRIGAAMVGGGRARLSGLLGLIFVSVFFISSVFSSWLPMLMLGKGLSSDAIPMTMFGFAAGGVIGSIAIGRAVDAFGYLRVLIPCHVILTLSLAGLAHSSTPALYVLFNILIGATLLAIIYSLYSVAASFYPETMRGAAAGVLMAIGRVGNGFGPVIAGLLLSYGASPSELVFLLAPVAALSGAALLLLKGGVARIDQPVAKG